MMTLLTHVTHRGHDHLSIYLDVLPKDLKAKGLACDNLMDEAKKTGRCVGLIVRQYGGNTFFTYHPDQQHQVEVQLLASLLTPGAEVHVNNGVSEGVTWRT